ncbi:polysaccharide pyruvyl transferase family protein [bacterium]|nr:polysaccharide pyruvyl transferase family protein [bacterium]
MIEFLKFLFRDNCKKKYKLFYFYKRKNKNAGDIFNVDLLEYFNIAYKRSSKIQNTNLICVGSLLHLLSKPSKRKLLIAGVGFLFPPSGNECINREVEVLALRGKLSKQRMENMLKKSLNNCVLGDPGLLVSKIYPQTVSKKYKVGIIPHYADKEKWNSERIDIKDGNYKIIDIQNDVKDVVREICECECILSSSLHGLIFADSYNIPNRQLIMSDKVVGENYKFKDYYSAFGLELPPAIDIRKEIIDDSIIENIINSYIPKDIETKQAELERVFETIAENVK